MTERIRGEVPSVLDPRSPHAEAVAELSWLLFAVAGAIYLLVLGLLALAAFRSGRHCLPGGDNGFLVILGIVMPAVVLLGVMGVTLAVGDEAEAEPALTVEVVGNQFWWEVRYGDVVTANELHIPVGEPVEVLLTTDDVIHSFWVPQLGGKVDMIPGRDNRTRLLADEPGVYLGECAEFCGIQHARMQLVVVAEPREDFDVWLEGEAEQAAEPTSALAARGREVFLDTSCAACHTIRGVAETGELGPDLTHLASRLTLAAGTLENTKGHLGGWILDPQGLKPGVRMPPTDLDGEQLQALLAYLETLE